MLKGLGVGVPRAACRYVRHIRAAMVGSSARTMAGDLAVVANDAS
jgi:hypothetical protein